MKYFILSLSLGIFTLNSFSQPLSFESRGIGGGGALFSPSINPANPNEFYIACDMSELFHTSDYGLNFDQVHFTEFGGGHNSKVCFTNTSGLLYSISYINDIGTPVLSNDNGVTWSTLSGNPDPSEDTYTIHVDYNNPNRIIISYYGEIFYSSNSGTSFTSIHTAGTGNGNVVGGVLFDGTNIYIGTNDGVLVSTNGGSTWAIATITGIPAGEVIWSFCAAKVGATTRFFCLTGNSGDVYVGLPGSDYWGFMQGVYSCDYGSTNWVPKMTGIAATDYPMFVAMAENDINTVYLAGSNDNSEPIVLKTTNAGTSWSDVLITANNQNVFTGWQGQGGDRGWSYGECPFGVAVCPTNSNYVVFGDFGFPHVTSNGGTSWNQAYVDATDQHAMNTIITPGQAYHSIGIENTTSWQVYWMDANNMWACFSDIRGKRSNDGGDSWSFNYSGNIANSSYRIAENTTGLLVMGTSGIHDMYQSTRLTDAILDAADAQGRVRYSTDNGQTWIDMFNFGHPVFWVETDPNDSENAYLSVINHAGGGMPGGVYRTTELSNLTLAAWNFTGAPPRTEGHPACLKILNDGTLIATFSGRRNSGGTFTASSGIFSYNPTTGVWTDLSDPGMYYWTKDVVVDPNDPLQNTWYVSVFSGWGGPPNGLGGLYKTTNRGTTWTKLTGTTLDRVTSCTFNPNNSNEMYITTEGQGLWMSSNINSGTPTFAMVNSYPFRQPERVFFNPYNSNEMWVTSFGNGMKVADFTMNVPKEEKKSLIKIYPNPAQNFVILEGAQNEIVNLYSITGELIRSVAITTTHERIDVSDLVNGVYLLQCGSRNEKLIIRK